MLQTCIHIRKIKHEEEITALTAEKVALQLHTTISTIQASGVSGGLDNDEAFCSS